MERDRTPLFLTAVFGRRRRRRPRPTALLARLAVTALVAVAALGAIQPSARADGDPGSDVLVSNLLFLPADAHVPPQQQEQLTSLIRSVNRSGFKIRVAVIAKPDDLGAVAALWHKPAAYARFLRVELSLVYKQRLLIVMPNGFGFNWPGHPASAARRLLDKIPVKPGDGLAGPTETAVRTLATASGATASGATASGEPTAPASSAGGGWPLILAAVLSVLAVGALCAFLVIRRRRRPATAEPGGSEPASGDNTAPGDNRRASRFRWRLAIPGALAVVVIGTAGTAFAITRTRNASAEQSLRPSGIPASISTSLANEMAIDRLGQQAAPAFTLSDQKGRKIGLASLRGKVVVLDFMDDRCTNVCPVVSQEFVYAHRDLGSLASRVVFIGVNVNPYYLKVTDVAAFTNEHRLDKLPGWHYFTGTVQELKTVWRDYHITITAPNRHDVIHTSAIYIIDPQGRERYLADADVETPQVRYHSNGQAYIPGGTEPAWGHGIAELARAALSGN